MKIVLVTGGFDPIHSGHIEYFKSAKELGDMLIVGINSDEWLIRKKGRPFMNWVERNVIVSNLDPVDATLGFDDSDGSAIDAIRKIKELYPNDDIIFANGGDRTSYNIPEMMEKDVLFKFGVGGRDKKNSSSWILKDWKEPKTPRPWGYYRILHEVPGMKVKELTVNPGCSLSMQKHRLREEYWIVSHGACVVNSVKADGTPLPPTLLSEHLSLNIGTEEWHQLTNPYEVPCKIVEVQYGLECIEEDIERK